MRLRSVMVVLLALSILAALLVPAVLSQEECTETLDSDGTTNGEWAAGCNSQTDAPGAGDEQRYARFYTFTLAESSEVTIVLESSDADTFLYLREGEAKSGTTLHLNDDDGSTSRSRIQEILAAGDYTIEATTYSGGETGDFTLTISGLSEAETGDRLVLITEPGPGHFHHDTDRYDSGAVYHSLDTDPLYDAAASGWFENPHSASEGAFSYGFVLRDDGVNPRIFFMVYSSRQWAIVVGDIIHRGTASGLRTNGYANNYLSIVVIGKWAAVSLNGVSLTNSLGHDLFNVGSETGSGKVLVRGAGQGGTITHYDSIQVYEITPDDFVEDRREASGFSREFSQESTPKDATFDKLEEAIPNP